MKKVMSVLLVLVLMFALCACGEESNSSVGTANAQDKTENAANTENKGENTANTDSYPTQNVADFMALLKSKLNMSDYEFNNVYDNSRFGI